MLNGLLARFKAFTINSRNMHSTVLATYLLSSLSFSAYVSPARATLGDSLLAQENQLQNLVEVPSFYVTVTLTDPARQRLESADEAIVIVATLLGEASADATLALDESGRVDLLSSQHELTGSGRTTQFNDLEIASSTVDQLASRDYTVNINAGSGRRSSDDNVLACDFFEGKMSNLQPGVTLQCGLIGEYDNQFLSISNHSVRRSLSD
jgi:hypothetical protein